MYIRERGRTQRATREAPVRYGAAQKQNTVQHRTVPPWYHGRSSNHSSTGSWSMGVAMPRAADYLSRKRASDGSRRLDDDGLWGSGRKGEAKPVTAEERSRCSTTGHRRLLSSPVGEVDIVIIARRCSCVPPTYESPAVRIRLRCWGEASVRWAVCAECGGGEASHQICTP